MSKLLLTSVLFFSGFVPLESKASSAPVNCVRAVQSLNLYFGVQVPTYGIPQILDSLKFCRANDWNRQVALRVSKSKTWDDYNYFAIPATALRGTNLANLRKWMCSVMMDRRRDNYDQNVFVVLPGCGEKLGANTRRYVTTTTSTTSTTTTTTLPTNLPKVFIKATNNTSLSSDFTNFYVWGKVDQQGNGAPEEWCLLLNGSKDWYKEASSLKIAADKKSGELCESTDGRGSLTEFTALRGFGTSRPGYGYGPGVESLGCVPKGLSGVTVCMTATLILSFKFNNGREVQSDPFTIYLRNRNNKLYPTEFFWVPCTDVIDGSNFYCP